MMTVSQTKTPCIALFSKEKFRPRIGTCFFKIPSNMVLPSTLGLPKGLLPVGVPVKILKPLLPSSILANDLPMSIF